ncbi:MAG: manganese transporter [Planctomycetaceae bacterium]|nr:manganese transporter [Planctomycetaceae bacterium]
MTTPTDTSLELGPHRKGEAPAEPAPGARSKLGRNLALLAWLALAAVLGCTPHEAHDSATGHAKANHRYAGDGPVRVVCTTGQVAELVRRVGGDRVRVEALMGPGVDPHLYSPAASDVSRLTEADAIVYNGLHLEGRMAELFEKLADRRFTLAVTAGLVERRDARLRKPPEFADLYDPHVWHDAALWADCVADVAAALGEFDPKFAEAYQTNAATYREELLASDAECRESIAALPQARRVLITAHDAFGYYGAAYGLEVFGLKGISTEEEKDLAWQAELQRIIIDRNIPAVFVESAVAPRVLQALVEPVRGSGHDLQLPDEPLYADALGPADSDAATYSGMLRHNTRVIVEALAP